MTQLQATAQNDFLVSVPCCTASFSDQADVALALHLIYLCFTLDSCTTIPSWIGHDATTSSWGRNGWQKSTAAGGVAWSSLPQYSAPLFPAYLLSELLWLGEAAITTLCLKFISSGQSDSSERQNLWTIPELNKEGRRNAKGGGAIWPSGDREAKKLQTLAFDDLLWPWPYVSYQQVSGPWMLHTSRENLHPLPWSPGVAQRQLPRQEHNLPLSASHRSNACERKKND